MTSPGRLPILPDSQRPSADRPPPPNGGSRRRGLGRGLGALIPGAEAVTERPTEVALSRLRANPFQPRQAMDPQEFSGLVESVRRHGVLQPIVARPAGDGFEVVAGERRWRAAERARAYRRLMSEFGITQEQVAQRVGKSQPSIANSVRLLQLPQQILTSLQAG